MPVFSFFVLHEHLIAHFSCTSRANICNYTALYVAKDLVVVGFAGLLACSFALLFFSIVLASRKQHPPLPTENLLEVTDGLLRPPF